MLLDPSSYQLVATAASGLEEGVQQRVRIPVGRGFAGQIAAQRRPVVLEEVDDTNLVNPILLEKGRPVADGRPAAGRRQGARPVGVPGSHRRQVTSLGFPPGAVLCLYTDGLVERRDQPIDEGITRLAAAVTPGDPEAGCTAVMAAMAHYSTHSDDIACSSSAAPRPGR